MTNPILLTHYFTFGQNHHHTIGNTTYDHNIVVTVKAPNTTTARKEFVKIFDDKWAFQYSKKPEMGFFPRGLTPLPKGTI